MYRSDLLRDLPGGIRSLAWYGETRLPDGSAWLWLEDVTDDMDDPWPLDWYARVARRLGQFNGTYLANRPLPADPCLSRRWLRGWVEAAGPAVAELANVADHPLIRQVYPSHVIAAYTRLWATRHTRYALLDQLPQTFCHLDAFRRNLFLRRGPNGEEATVLIDWAFAGLAGVGEDLAPLVAGTVSFMGVPVDVARQLEALALESYTEGLRDTGWLGDPELVRRGYETAAAMRYGVGVVRLLPSLLLDERLHPVLEQLFGSPMSKIVMHLAAVNDWLADLVPDQ